MEREFGVNDLFDGTKRGLLVVSRINDGVFEVDGG